jgi:protein transport protein SEC20
MGTSKQLITALEGADWIDRMLILSAFVFFVLVVLFVLKQRILDRGIRIAFWWTRFLPDFSGDANLLADVEEKGAQAASVVSSLATDASRRVKRKFLCSLRSLGYD